MSFRLFVYWCALCGGWAAAAGWVFGRLLAGDNPLGNAGVKGMFLGMMIALALGCVDALWVYSLRQPARIVPRVLACIVVGTIGGLFGGFAGQVLFDWHNLPVLLILGWGLTGLMVGVSLGVFDFLSAWVRDENLRGGRRKMLRAVAGGAAGGLLGGFLYEQLSGSLAAFFPDKADLWSPSFVGFVVLGLCIGLMIGLAQVVLKEAWLRVEAGFRKGRELPLHKEVLTIGRAESCDVGMFGDPGVDPLHARIYRRGNGYLIADAASAGGTFVNDVRIGAPAALHSGDLIRLGKSLLRFRERQKRSR